MIYSHADLGSEPVLDNGDLRSETPKATRRGRPWTRAVQSLLQGARDDDQIESNERADDLRDQCVIA